ncbi:helix-turn-helix transcriptional regulator [Pleurocapsales cyanobacterium LEGE 06147]|nr:helix-turn-helix transcriptional regulator [Pleurocapsales cyanobacterium LEGE 06147]
MEIVTSEQFNQRIQETLQQIELQHHVNGFDCISKSRHRYSTDDCHFVELRPGLHLEIMTNCYHHSVSIQNEHDDFPELVSKFYLSGHHRAISSDIENSEKGYSETAGNNYLFYLPDIEETEQYFADNQVQMVRIAWDLDFLRAIAPGLEVLPAQLRPLLNKDYPAPRFHREVGRLTPAMQLILQQLFQASFQGIVQRLYLESKVLELLAFQLLQVIEAERGKLSQIKLKPHEVERLYQARDILLHRSTNPPTLIDLAHQVGLHHMKLKQGFRQLFGTTVFGYLFSYRMESARQLLRESQLSVAEIAEAVGYANQGHFAAAFRRKFGITPSACRKGDL